jgi:4-hydroxythreonine-4-phosphate dehydrogenase
MAKPKIGISIGDINGIGLEVILKTLNNSQINKYCIPVIYGSSKVVSYHKNVVEAEQFQYQNAKDAAHAADDGKAQVVNVWSDNVNITLGKATDVGGKYAFKSLEAAVIDLKNGSIDALVTAPINKQAMKLGGFNYPGHTEYIAAQFGSTNSLMMMVSDELRVAVVTGHIPLKEVSGTLTKQLILNKLQILNETLKIDFGKEKPLIAVLGLNPHAGDEGVLGDEEQTILHPAMVEAKKKGILALGPFAADGFFGAGQFKKFDAVLAMYHDQGLVPFKTLAFGGGVNYTAGLIAIRTSPDHGTGYDIAGTNMADESSFRKALFQALDILKSRRAYTEMHANPLVKRERNFIDEVPNF